ncbi:interferon-induced GTP-binding protein Mx [Sarotherodon galilaeus]
MPDLPVTPNVTVVVTQDTDECLITEPSFTPERVGVPKAHAYQGADATVSVAAAAAAADASPHSPSNNGNSSSVNHTQTHAAVVEPIVQSGSGSHSQLSIREIPNFNARELRERLDFRDISLDDPEQVPERVRSCLANVIDRAVAGSQQGCVLNVVLRGPSLASDVQAVLNPDDQYDPDLFLDQIAQVMQSNDESIGDDELEFIVTVAQNSSGGGARLKLANIPYDEILSKKGKHMYTPNNTHNNLCFSLCIAHSLNPTAPEHEKYATAKQLHAQVGLRDTQTVSFSDVCKFEKHLNVKIVIYYHAAGRKRLHTFFTHDEPNPNTVMLYLHNEHYHLIEKPTAFLGSAYVCNFCYNTYESPLYHSCKHRCNVCFTLCHHHRGPTVKCSDCNRICKSQHCYQQHKLPEIKHNMVPCDNMKHCMSCGVTYKKSKKSPHRCVQPKCEHCREPKLAGDSEHQCFIQPVEQQKPCDKYILYDFETRYHNGKHEANFVCASDLKGNKFTYNTLKCVAAFVQHYRRPRFRGYTFIAHNASGFDNYILLEYMVKQCITPTVTMRGSRVILMHDKEYDQRWIDSFSFLPMGLAKIPSALGFQDLQKGHFPHRFNTRDNEYYVGPYPDPSFYGYERMSESGKASFMEWYQTASQNTFDFQVELRRYCVNDVDVLRKACTIYRDTLLGCTQVDPFMHTTLAAFSMGVYKTLFLPRDTLALTYDGAYVEQNKTFSNVSIEWLQYVSHTTNTVIKHALRGGEQRVGPYFLDGFDPVDHTAYEFAGCFHHGCVKCYPESEVNPVSKASYGLLHRMFCDKVDALKSQYSLSVVVMWECEWAALKQTDPAVVAFMHTYRKPERLNPRDALFGGRTNAIKLYHKVACDEKIFYYDFTSLYPTVQSKKDYPVGHPQIIYSNFDKLENYFGFVKCTVLPPRGLFHPVLPYRCHGKLMFPLCSMCAEDQNQHTACGHSDSERVLKGTWVSFELEKAVELGYKLVSIDEVWHFPNKTDTLFKDYVKAFLKLKQEASGYPEHVKTPEEQQKYIAEYYEKEGIMLDPSKICVNKAVRNCNKLLLNSLWGRFSMRSNMASSELITDPSRFSQLMFSDQYDVRQFCFISDDVAMVQWRHADGRASRVKDVNVFVGAMTTAHARLMLYDLLDSLQQRVLYCDTDSVIFTARPGDWMPPLGPFLGDLTSELASGEGSVEDHIVEFVSGGPKCYAYHTSLGKTQVKCKGVTLNAQNSKVVTHESLKGLVHKFVSNQVSDAHLVAVSDNIKRDKKKFHLKNVSVVKKLKVVYNKRRVLPDYTTLPYGF